MKRVLIFCFVFLAIGRTLLGTDAAYWRSLSPTERRAYVQGYTAAAFYETSELLLHLSKTGCLAKKRTCEDAHDHPRGGSSDALAQGVTAIYDDPANAYIVIGDAMSISWNRLRGKETDSQVMEARRRGLWLKEQVKQ